MEHQFAGDQPAAEAVAPVSAAEPQELSAVALDPETPPSGPDEAATDSESEPQSDYEVLYAQECMEHAVTKAALKSAQATVARASAMGFSGGAGVHNGA